MNLITNWSSNALHLYNKSCAICNNDDGIEKQVVIQVLRAIKKACEVHKLSKQTDIRQLPDGTVCLFDFHGCNRDQHRYLVFYLITCCKTPLEELHEMYKDIQGYEASYVINDCLPSVDDVLPLLTGKPTAQIKLVSTYLISSLYNKNKQKLFHVFNKVTGSYNKHVESLILSKHNDVSILEKLHKKFLKSDTEVAQFRTQQRVLDFEKMVDVRLIKTFVDLGGGNGSFAHSVGLLCKDYNNNECITISVDLQRWYSKDHQSNQLFDDVEYLFVTSSVLPFDDNCISCISILQVLHHVENPLFTLSEAYRVLVDGGVLFIREHDCNTHEDELVIDIEHFIYEVSYSNNRNFCSTYEAMYLSRTYLTSLLETVGFEPVHTTDVKGISNCYYTVWRKPVITK